MGDGVRTILALGNPGDRYRDTRHNAGWWLADHLRAAWGWPPFSREGRSVWTRGSAAGRAVRILKPLTYVNRSGLALEDLLREPGFRLDELLVLVDDVSLPPEGFRLRGRGSAGGHNGLASIEQAAGSREYGRLRIGVGAPRTAEIDLADWVLAPPAPAEEEVILSGFGSLTEAVCCWIAEGMESAMNRFNRS